MRPTFLVFSASIFCSILPPIVGADLPSSLQQSVLTDLPISPQPPAKYKILARDIVVAPDGAATFTTHSELQVLKQSAIAAFSQQTLPYMETTQTLEIKEAYTLKADGRKLLVEPNGIFSQQAVRSENSPLYTDHKVKIIVYPNVEVGDILVYTSILRAQPALPGHFTYDTVIPPSLYIETGKTTISTPSTLPLTTDTRDIATGKETTINSTTHWAHYSNSASLPYDNKPLSLFDWAPRFSASTFKTYDELAAAYAAATEAKAAITPAIKMKADEITSGITDERERAKKIYEWVSIHIRYVAVEFGVGSIIPHSADNVLKNGYGDCKDHAVLFAALLRAKNIDSNLVLIGTSNNYSVAKAPTFGAFNHVMTWIPSLNIYADTTARNLAFGYLVHAEYGKPVLRISNKGTNALQHTPILNADQAVIKYIATDKFNDRGNVIGSNTTTGWGVFAGLLRSVGEELQTDDANKFANELLAAHGMPHAVGSFSPPPIVELGDSYVVSGSYKTTGEERAALDGAAIPVPDGLHLFPIVGSTLLGAVAEDKFKSATAVPCFSGHVTEDYTLEAPSGMMPSTYPSDVRVVSEHIDYSSHWIPTTRSLTVHRDFKASFHDALCSGDELQEARRAIARIHTDLKGRVSFTHTH